MTQLKLNFIQRLNLVKALLAAITLIALIFYPYIPNKSLEFLSGDDYWWGAYTDSFNGGNSRFVYLNEDQTAIQCFMGDTGSFNFCGNNAVFGNNDVATYDQLISDPNFAISISPQITRDLSRYLGMWVDIDYRGPAKFIYLSLQNHEPAADLADPNRQFRSQSVGISTSELDKPVYIRLEDFNVADWWVKQFSLHRTKAGARFDSIRTIGIEVKDEEPHSEHHIQITSIKFIGEWISKENFYFGIITILTTLLVFEVTLRVYSLYLKQRTAQKSIEELSKHNKNLQSAAYKDELTQLLNRRAINEVVLKEQTLKKDQAIAILIIDIDDFKTFNDTYGHTVGDKVLVSVAQSLKNSSRHYDQVARWGGEEFLIITRGSKAENLLIYANKLREIIASTAISYDKNSEAIYLTISIGIAIADTDEDFEKSFERADAALYQSKSKGRNCCTIIDGKS